MNNVNLAPRPTRSILRNRRIVLDLKAGINGSYVGQEGLKGSAQKNFKSTPADRNELMFKIAAAAIITIAGLFLVAVLG